MNEKIDKARELIRSMRDTTQSTQDQQPDWAGAILYVLMEIRGELTEIRKELERLHEFERNTR